MATLATPSDIGTASLRIFAAALLASADENEIADTRRLVLEDIGRALAAAPDRVLADIAGHVADEHDAESARSRFAAGPRRTVVLPPRDDPGTLAAGPSNPWAPRPLSECETAWALEAPPFARPVHMEVRHAR